VSNDSEDDRKKALRDGLTEMAASFRVAEVPAAMLRAYWAALGEFSCDRIRMAFDGAVKREEFWPPPAKVRKYAISSVASLYPELTEISKR
jgi:hypothetical protein